MTGKDITKPTRQYMNNTKVARFLPTAKGVLKTGGTYAAGTIESHPVIMTLDPDADICSKDITCLDISVMDAIYTLFLAGNEFFSAGSVMKVLSGNMSRNITDDDRTVIAESIDKLRSVMVKLDCTDELQKRRSIGKDEKFVVESYMLPVEKLTYTAGNQAQIEGYRFLDEPPLYKYARMTKQIIDLDAGMLDTHEYLRDTLECILIKRYLARRISLMANKRNRMRSTFIAFERTDPATGKRSGIFPETGIDISAQRYGREKKRKMTVMAKKILEAFTEKGFIKGFTERRGPKRTVEGFEILLRDDEKT